MKLFESLCLDSALRVEILCELYLSLSIKIFLPATFEIPAKSPRKFLARHLNEVHQSRYCDCFVGNVARVSALGTAFQHQSGRM